jgi:hypothetical protein
MMKGRKDTRTGTVHGALALEVRADAAAAASPLDARRIEAVAAALRLNLDAECAEARALSLHLCGGLRDAAELLRPGWPLHRLPATDRSATGAAFCADNPASTPSRSLLALPFVLGGPADAVALAAAHFDHNRLQAYTPRARNPAFEVPHLPMFEAIGYLSVRSLGAVLSRRYYSQGLGLLWPLIEAALFAPAREVWLDAPGEPLLRQHGGRVRMAAFDRESWARHAGRDASSEQTTQRYAAFCERELQCLQTLARHGIPIETKVCRGDDDPRRRLRDTADAATSAA